MIASNLSSVADNVIRRAQRQGSVVPREVREELAQAGFPENLWKDVLALARSSLSYRRGRYHYSPPVSDRVKKEQEHQARLQKAVRQIIRQYRNNNGGVERRRQDRVEFIQPVTVRGEDQREFTLLSRDLSTNGIRLIGTRHLLGHKVQVRLPCGQGNQSWTFVVRILWTSAIGEDLFENGGIFLEAVPPEAK